jgi:enoyl-CoA hydratase/carnithine racemase
VTGNFFQIEERQGVRILRLQSADGTNRLMLKWVLALTDAIRKLASENRPLVIAGNNKFFSAGAELEEIAALDGPTAYEFSKKGQVLMTAIETLRAPAYAAIAGYCMGGGFDLALACRRRIASPHAIFGHRGAALGLITGWGETQRLPRLIGKGRALELLVAAEKVHAARAFEIGLVDAIAEDPVTEAILRSKQ